MLPAQPRGEDGVDRPFDGSQETGPRDLYKETMDAMVPPGTVDDDAPTEEDGEQPSDQEFLRLVNYAEEQALLYMNQINRRTWASSYRAYHNQHFQGSKYDSPDWKARSKIFVPKTRASVRRDMAALAASLFGSVDAVRCSPGNEGDPKQRAAAALMQEVVNYRTDRTSGRASIPWFHVAMGARQDCLLTGVCLSKQYWKLELRRSPKPEESQEKNPVTGEMETVKQRVWRPFIDRPEIELFPPENFVIDPAAVWTHPVQSAAYVILKYPMHVDEVKAKAKDPRNPWHEVAEEMLVNSKKQSKFEMAAIRRAREFGIDRLDDVQNTGDFKIVWVYETFMRVDGIDYTFFSVSDKAMLTDPKPVDEVYPEQHGERPIVMGYGNLETHRIFPMSPVESWRQLQLETNDIRNLTLDAIKTNVTPVTKVVRGRNVDLDQLKRRAATSSILVTKPDDVTWDRPPEIPQSTVMMQQRLDTEFDDLAGQYNASTVQNNNAMERTLGGLKLAAGAANAVQEFDLRVFIETWCEPVLAQTIRLEQYYESDAIVLGLAGDRAQLWQKHGVDTITDELLEQEVTLRVNIGLGAGDPQQRLGKFASAIQIVVPLLMQSPKFKSGEYEMDEDSIMEEVFGAVGYRDGGKRFVRKNPEPKPNQMGDLQMEKLKSEISKNKATGKASLMQGLSALAKVVLGDKVLEADMANSLLDRRDSDADQYLAALDHGHRHGMEMGGMLHGAYREPPPGEEGGAGAGNGAVARPAPTPRQGQPGAAPPTPQGEEGEGQEGQELMVAMENHQMLQQVLQLLSVIVGRMQQPPMSRPALPPPGGMPQRPMNGGMPPMNGNGQFPQ